MQLSSNQKHRIRRISLTPLIDVVFLLLIFFMLSSSFLKFIDIPVGGGTGESSSTKPQKTDFIAITIEEDGAIKINGEKTELASLTEKLNELNKQGKDQAFIQARKGQKAQQLINVLHQAKKSTLKKVLIIR